MNGSIRKRGEKTWELTIDLGRDAAGKRKRKFVSVKGTKSQAQQKLRELLTSLDKGMPVDTSKLTLGEFLRMWLQDYVAIKTAASTADGYRIIVECHLIPALGHVPLSKLQPADLQAYYKKALAEGRRDRKGGLSARTVHHHHRILSEALKHAVKWQLVHRNVADAVDPPKPGRYEAVSLSPEEVDQLLCSAQAHGAPYYELIYTAIYTGMRRGELLGLRWRDVDLDMAILSVVRTLQRVQGEFILKEPKTARGRRDIALTPDLAILLRGFRANCEEQRRLLDLPIDDTDLVFAHYDGSPLDPGTVSHISKKIVKKAGLESRLHDNRHAFATLMMSFGVNPKVVSEMLGHSTIATTMDIYSHVPLGLQREAVQTLQEGLKRYQAPEKSTPVEIGIN